ncbi:major facilitator superfamily domain-containing protein 4A-like isoform X2 [Cyprinus carpio]|uniref:Major facilitator superfamily domain-containing protein 4A-like isoform X1 n=1 Tax=Cyprinus carpio TaxID=7962 RepID=A0A9Q9YM18_CYPCA|nr:major facilitator superfamily domain-containing protein 4A-like isoform X1 [Cyprinus carpio]XP_042622713.1 major facilitator superfamily domain-containing protein 4A-like isoform X2 [Cyprinus carpio]
MKQLLNERICALFRSNWQHTLTYWSVFFSFGLCVAFLGPTILDLRCQTQSTLQEITLVFFSQQFFLFIGSTIGGFFSKTLVSSLSALAVSSLTISVVFAVIPLCHKLLVLAFAMAVSGLAMGIIDTISNLQLVKIYQKDSTVFLQALHFFVGLGALVSPLIADPFLSETSCVIGNSSTNATSLRDLRNKLAGRHVHNVSNVHLHTDGEVVTNVSYAFWIMAVINLPVPIAILILMYRERLFVCGSDPSRRLLDGDVLAMKTWGTTGLTEDAGHQKDTSRSHEGLFGCCLLGNVRSFPLSFFGIHILGGLVLFFSDGIVGSYTGFVYTYAVAPPMNLAHKTAGYLTCVFWAAIIAGRLSAIPLSYRFKPVRLLIVSQVGVIVTLLLLLIFSSSSVFLFIGTCCLGLFISSIFPCMLAFTEDILEYKGCATTVMVTSAGMGEMLLQVLVGLVMHNQGSFSFLLCGMIFGCLGFAAFILLFFAQQRHKNFMEALPGDSPTERLEENGIKTCSAGVLNSWDTSEQKASIDP